MSKIPMTVQTSGHKSCKRQFTIRHADGKVSTDGAPWEAVEDADRDARLWDTICDCGGPHSVLVRWQHEAVTAWQPWEALDE